MIFRDVYCQVCGMKMLKNKAKKVTCKFLKYTINFPLGIETTIQKYYCLSHAPRYDEKDVRSNYYTRMRVNENGEPIGYKKEK